MTEEVLNEEQANPYNLKKSWHEGTDEPFKSADQLYFEDPSEKNKLFKSNNVNEAEQEGNVEVDNLDAPKDEPYKKPDYKKRYDDLKRHYDSKLNEFKQREEELIKQAVPEYRAPKTPEELEEFKKSYPDVFEVVETVAHMQSESKAKVLEERLSKLQEREQEISQQEAEKRLRERHPDFEKVWSEREIAAMSMDEFDKYESEISEAMQQGRIVK
jgi:hypothetical protein